MTRYMLTRKQKKAIVLDGIKREMRGSLLVQGMVPILFKPMVIVSVPDDVDMSGSVNSGIIVVIPERAQTPQPEFIPPVLNVTVEMPAPKEEVFEEVPLSDSEGYTEMDNGGFRCSYCGKEYKPSPRAEVLMKAHVEKEHE